MRSCDVAVGVSVIAAFRARSLVGRLDFSVDVVEAGGSRTGFDFCASISFMLTLCVLGRFAEATSYSPILCEGLELLISGDEPAIEVSGTFILRGGGGTASRE